MISASPSSADAFRVRLGTDAAAAVPGRRTCCKAVATSCCAAFLISIFFTGTCEFVKSALHQKGKEIIKGLCMLTSKKVIGFGLSVWPLRSEWHVQVPAAVGSKIYLVAYIIAISSASGSLKVNTYTGYYSSTQSWSIFSTCSGLKACTGPSDALFSMIGTQSRHTWFQPEMKCCRSIMALSRSTRARCNLLRPIANDMKVRRMSWVFEVVT